MKSFLRLLLLFVLMCPVSIFASVTYNMAKNIARDYYISSKDNYYIINTRLITKKEFELESLDVVNGNVKNRPSYLTTSGLEFWTSDQVPDQTKAYVIKEGLGQKYTGESSTSGVRVVAELEKNVRVKGSGTLHNPWVFDDIKTISFSTDVDSSKGWLSNGGCCFIGNKKQNITLSVLPGTTYYISLCAGEGYKIVDLEESCDVKLTHMGDGIYEIKNIFNNSPDNMNCKVKFVSK